MLTMTQTPLPHYWPFAWGKYQWLAIPCTKGQQFRALMISLMLVEISSWTNSPVASEMKWQWSGDTILMQQNLPISSTIHTPVYRSRSYAHRHITENKISSIWQLCYHWWHRKLSLWQLTVSPVMVKLPNWQPFVFSVHLWWWQKSKCSNLEHC